MVIELFDLLEEAFCVYVYIYAYMCVCVSCVL